MEGGKPLLAYWDFEGPELENFPAWLERAASGLDEFAPSAANAGRHSRSLTDEAVGLTGTITGVNAVFADTPGHMADVNTSFAVTSNERLPEMIGQMGTLATVDALGRLAAAPQAPTRSGGSAGGWGPSAGGSADAGLTGSDSVEAKRARLLASATPNLEELFQQQKFKGHDIPGFRDARHWWQEHLAHVAKLTYGYAQGTSFAPGGVALVGEMGPELVNLPRGSQVIPNPRLGSEVTVNVTVEGSVVAERDLAQRTRQELIRTSRRTVDLGFVA